MGHAVCCRPLPSVLFCVFALLWVTEEKQEGNEMSFNNPVFKAITVLSVCSGSLLAAGAASGSSYPDSIASHDEMSMQQLASKMFVQLPREHQVKIAQSGGIGSAGFSDTILDVHSDAPPLPEVDPDITAHEYLELIVSDELAQRLNDGQWNILNAIADTLDEGKTVPHMCFSPDTDREYAFAVNQLIEFPFQVRFQQTGRWSSTATDGGGLNQGLPTTLTYSFVPDGTFVPDLGIGLGSGNSALFAWLDGVYGDTQTWQDLFHQVFDRWEELIGVTYVFEPNDDGANTNSAGGSLGVRGDVRITAYNFANDGSGGVLAYNNFPNDGDMVFDAFDTFYNNLANNSLRFRNVTAHEHGHGLGMLHVCPANQTKLMEPFISTAYDGPQLDDVLNGIRHYGDNNEPDNSIAEATDLGSFNIGGAVAISNLGIDDNSDDDFFRVNLNGPSRVLFAVAPDADEYDQGPQTQSCGPANNLTDYNSIQNLRITAFDASGNTLATTDANGLGGNETMNFDSIDGGEVFFRVDGSTNVNNVQRYQMSALVVDLPFLGPVINADVPEAVDPGVPTAFNVNIDPRQDIVVMDSAMLFTSINGSAFTGTPLVNIGGDDFTATIPSVDCDETLEFYIRAEGDTGGVVNLPAAGASDPFSAVVGTIVVSFEDDFQSNMGWTVSGDVNTQALGVWQRGVPAGDGSRGDAPNDADGSGSCYLTGNGGPGSNTDVDDGQTILNSPIFDLSANPEAVISYSRWYDNTGSGNGAAPGADVFTVQITNNLGVSWTTLEVVGPSTSQSSGGWFDASFRVADFVEPTNLVQVRFIAEDAGEGSVIEAAVDAVEVKGLTCEDPETCPADLTGDGELDFFDVSAFLSAFNANDPAADFTGDGNFDFFDVSAFLSAFNAGCP